MPRPIHAVIHQPALANNLDVVRRCAPQSRVWAVIKANAYGHGIRRAFAGLRAADGFGLLDLNEAVLLRELGWQGPILLLEGFFQPQDVPLLEQYRLTTAVHCEEQLRMLEVARPKGPLGIQLKLNTGMNRLGFRPEQYRTAWERARTLSCVGSIVHMTHFSDADSARGIAHQLDVFDATTANLPGEASLSNSAATLWHPQAHRAWVRPGVVLYGASPTGVAADVASFGLQPAMSLHSELISVQDLQPGDTVGYGSLFKAERPMRIGRGGLRLRHMICVDLTPCPKAKVGSAVTLWGQGLPIDDVAMASGTVGYELMCALAPRVPVTVATLTAPEQPALA
ncbi:alanine racemase [Cupriavidus basilensis OR16]|uniref:Alanine racemase n=1 Tax=Cupriavidus basilensis OR16 TaxID=1127483 RepID=H1SD90_9BURK|nr:alanine racemase [Cupriavidus basilensis]EHP39538.1 alanine racemase [Cupriavidus basilensis OR16]